MWQLAGLYYLGKMLWQWAKRQWPDAKKRRLDRTDMALPTATAGTPVPLAWGTNRIQQPLLVHRLGFNTIARAVGGAGNPTATVYGASMCFVLCMEPGQAEHVTIQRIWFGEKLVPTGTGDFDWHPIVADTAYNTDGGGGSSTEIPGHGLYFLSADFFGDHVFGIGDVGGNGYRGVIELRSGGADWTDTAFFAHYAFTAGDLTLMPNYRGQIKVALSGYSEQQGASGSGAAIPAGFEYGEEKEPQPPAFELSIGPFADETGMGVPQYYKLIGLDWNPIGIIHDLLVTRLEIPESKLDLVSFEAAATVLADELQGYSRAVYDLIDTNDLISEILDEIDGVRYWDPETGKLVIKLLRDDYDIGTLPVFDKANIVGDPELTLGSYAETSNLVHVIFNNREKEYAEDFSPAQNSASMAAIGRRFRPYRANGAKTAAAAGAIAARKLKLLTQPLKRLRMTATRDAVDLRPGSVFAYLYPQQHITTEMAFRVVSLGLGDPENGEVTIEAVQDAFHITGTLVVGDPDGIDDVPLVFPPAPIIELHTDHAPRWLLTRVEIAGGPSDATQRLLHLAYPNDYDVRMRADMFREAGAVVDFPGSDISPVSFPPTFTVETEYSREDDPYDTTVGLRIQAVENWTPATATETDIQSAGANIIRLGHGDGEEWIAFETVTDIGDGVKRLNNVWRGLFDTTPKTHPVGTRGYPISIYSDPEWSRRVGSRSSAPFGVGTETTINLTPIPISETGTAIATETTEIEAVKDFGTDATRTGPRIELPYPVADFVVNGLKAVPALVEDGAFVDWAPRSMTVDTVTRGDDPDETISAETTYSILLEKAGGEVTHVNELTDPPTTFFHLGAAGHGDLKIKVRTFLNWDGGTDERRSWQDAEVDVEALHWRNLVINPRFTISIGNGWAVTSGTELIATTALDQLGYKSGNRYVTGDADPDDLILEQVIPIGGYGGLASLTALAWFYTRNESGVADNVSLDVELLDVTNAVLDSDSYAGIPSDTNYERQVITVPMDPDATQLRLTATINGEASATPTARMTEFGARVCADSGELVTNGDFETDTAGWTTVSGTWSRVTGPAPYLGGAYLASTGSAASSQIYYEGTIPAGWQSGVGVLELARGGQTDTDDTQEITLQALDGAGGSVVASTTTGASAPFASNEWDRKRLYLDLPPATTHFRIVLDTVRVGDAGAPNGAFDDVSFRVFKPLDPDTDVTMDFTAPPETPLPASILRWYYDVPTIHPAPRAGLFAGGLAGEAAAPIAVPTSATVNTRFVGPWDGNTCVYNAYRTTRSGDPIRSTLSSYADFALGNLTMIAVVKTDEVGFSVASGLIGRRQAGATGKGWEISVNASGNPVAYLRGSIGAISVTSSVQIDDGMPHMVAMVCDDATDELSIVVDGTWDTVSAPVASIGVIRTFDSSRFGIGRAHADDNCFPGQIARVYMFFAALTEVQLDSWWKHNVAPTGVDTVTSDPCAVGVKGDANGVAVQWIPAGQLPYTYDFHFETGGENGWGLAVSRPTTNLASAGGDNPWTTPGGQVGATFTNNVEDVQGKLKGHSILGAETQYSHVEVALGAGTKVRHVLFARRPAGDGTVTAKFELRNSSDVLKGTVTKDIGEQWIRVDLDFGTAWDASTANGRIRAYSRNAAGSSTLILSGPHAVFQPATGYKGTPIALPIGGDASIVATTVDLDVAHFGLDSHFSSEGEIQLDGQAIGSPEMQACEILNLGHTVGADDIDRRIIGMTAGGDLAFQHFDQTEVGVTSEITPTAGALDDPWQIRARWCRSGIIEDPTLFAGFEFNAQVDYDRLATWTPALDDPPTAIRLGQISAGPDCLIRRLRIASREIVPGS